MILFNIVVAILLDEFIHCAASEKKARQMELYKSLEMPLDPLLKVLSTFSTPLELNECTTDIFVLLDEKDRGLLTFTEFEEGLQNLNLARPIQLSAEDWYILTDYGELCNKHDEISLDGFKQLLRNQMSTYILRRAQLDTFTGDAVQSSTINMLKLVFMALSLKADRPDYTELEHQLHFEQHNMGLMKGKSDDDAGRSRVGERRGRHGEGEPLPGDVKNKLDTAAAGSDPPQEATDASQTDASHERVGRGGRVDPDGGVQEGGQDVRRTSGGGVGDKVGGGDNGGGDKGGQVAGEGMSAARGLKDKTSVREMQVQEQTLPLPSEDQRTHIRRGDRGGEGIGGVMKVEAGERHRGQEARSRVACFSDTGERRGVQREEDSQHSEDSLFQHASRRQEPDAGQLHKEDNKGSSLLPSAKVEIRIFDHSTPKSGADGKEASRSDHQEHALGPQRSRQNMHGPFPAEAHHPPTVPS